MVQQAERVSNSIKKELPERYKMLADILPIGKQNSMTLDTIMKLCDIKERRNAYEIIEQLIIKHGYVILANRKGMYRGYFIPTNEDEFKESIVPFKQATASMNKRHKALLDNFYKD